MSPARTWNSLFVSDCPASALLLCLILLLAVAACTGQLDTPDGSTVMDTTAVPAAGGSTQGPGGPPVTAGQAQEQQNAIDAELSTVNPNLFDTALEYFPGQAVASAPKRVFRLTRTQLDNTTRTLLPTQFSASALVAVPSDPLQTNYEYSDNLSFSAANFTPYTSWVSALVAGVKANPSSVIDCGADNNSATCLADAAKAFVSRAFRGIVSVDQLTHFADFYASSVTEVGLSDATADLVDLVLTSPNYVFRDEVQTDSAQTLLPAQRLQHISYALADSPPEAMGLSYATADAQLGTAAALQSTIDQVLVTPQARDKLLRFFLAWLEVKEPENFALSSNVFPEFTPEVATAAVEETRAFLNHQLAGAAPKLKDLTESTQSFVSSSLAFIYGTNSAGATALVDLDPAQRLGLFTLPAVIASHSGPTTTRLVKRGVFFTRKVMCLPLGNPPQGVDTTVPTTAGATERQRIEGVTQQAPCSGCHAFINPFGFMLENYDAMGRYRTVDEQGLPINATINVDFLDEGTFSAASAVDALKGFTASARFEQCFARQLFRFYMGRDEGPGDDPLLRQMFFSFANNQEQDIVGMLRTLASSTAFSQRAEAL